MIWGDLRLVLILNLVIGLSQAQDPGEPLYLTPLINAGRIEDAREAARITDFLPIQGFSGLITVDGQQRNGANTFFWYFPAEPSYNEPDASIPLIIFFEGGPGLSDFRIIFSVNGPFLPVDELNYVPNPSSWHKKYHVIYIDNPIGVGFSHTQNPGGYASSSHEVALNTYAFLQQFLQMFPHLQPNPFYIYGTSYGGKFAIESAHLIHHANQLGKNIFVNLTGVIGDSPWVEAYTQAKYSDVLFGAGVISVNQRDTYLEREAYARQLIEEERWTEAAMLSNWFREDIWRTAGYNALDDLIDDGIRGKRINMARFIQLDSTRKAIHVGRLDYDEYNGTSAQYLAQDSMQSSAQKMDDLLKNDYRFLLLNGNVDVLTGQAGYRNLFENSISWEGKEELLNGDRIIWRVGGEVAGYTKDVGKVRWNWIRNAGHNTLFFQPEWAWEAIKAFLG